MTHDTRPLPLPARLQDLAAMASLLQRLDGGPREATAGQYRDVARSVGSLLAQAEPGVALDALLAVAPSAAELYENLQYAHAGLCRAPLHLALNAELAATAAIDKARRRS